MSKRKDRYGYLVVSDLGQPMHVGHYNDTPPHGVLLTGRPGQLFRDRRAADRAIARSAQYAFRRGFKWNTGRYRVHLIESAVHS